MGRLAGRGRADVVADAAARAARQARLAVQVGVGVRGLAAAAGRAGRAGLRVRAARLPRARRRLDRGLDRVRGRWRRWTTRCASTASGRALRALRRRARREADRRHPDLRRRRLGRRRRASRDLQARASVAGVPPDAFTDKGQLWGNPLYDWPALRRSGYAWWIARFRRIFELFDLARIDHFRGFTAYWAVPADAEFALEGSWKRGPGRAPFDAAPRGAGRAAADRRGPRRDHAAGHAAAAVARAAGHGGAAVRLHAVRAPHPARAGEPRREPDRLHGHPRQRHDPGVVRRARPTPSGRCSTRRSTSTASPTPSRTGR